MPRPLRRQIGVPRRAWSAREILHALLERGDAAEIRADGSVRIVLDVPAALVDELMAWDDAAREDEEIDHAADARASFWGGADAA